MDILSLRVEGSSRNTYKGISKFPFAFYMSCLQVNVACVWLYVHLIFAQRALFL